MHIYALVLNYHRFSALSINFVYLLFLEKVSSMLITNVMFSNRSSYHTSYNV